MSLTENSTSNASRVTQNSIAQQSPVTTQPSMTSSLLPPEQTRASVPKRSMHGTSSGGHASKCDNPQRWIFTMERLQEFPSFNKSFATVEDRHCRQQAANMIQDMSKALNIQPLATNTAIVYMHRFFVFHSFEHFDKFLVAACCVFLACKVEEQPRKLEHVILIYCKCCKVPESSMKGEEQRKRMQDFILHEQLLVETLGFDVRVEHPHSSVIKITEKIRASKDLAQTSYLLATNTLHLTTFCLQYPPVVTACVCINLACKWGHWMIPKSNEKKDWWQYFAPPDFTEKKLDALTKELVGIIDQSPAKMKDHLKRKCITAKPTCASPQTCQKEQTQTQTPTSVKKSASPTKQTPKHSSAHSEQKLPLPQPSDIANAIKLELSGPDTTSSQDVANHDSATPTPDTVDCSLPNKSVIKTEPLSSDPGNTSESKKKQLSLAAYKQRLTSQKKLSESSNASSPTVKVEPETEMVSKMTSDVPRNIPVETPPKKESKSKDDTISPGTDAIASLLKTSVAKAESKLSIETNQNSAKSANSQEAISPGAESIAKLLVSEKPPSFKVSEPSSRLSDLLKEDSRAKSDSFTVKRESTSEIEEGSRAINSLLATSVSDTSSAYSILNSEDFRKSSKHKSKEKDKKKKDKSSKSEKKEKHKSSHRKRYREDSESRHSFADSHESTNSNLRKVLKLSPDVKHDHPSSDPAPPLSTELGMETIQEEEEPRQPPLPNTRVPDHLISPSKPPPPPQDQPMANMRPPINPGSLGFLLESKRAVLSSGGEDEVSSKKSHKSKDKKKRKDHKRERYDDEDFDDNDEASKKHKKSSKKKSKSSKEPYRDSDMPPIATTAEGGGLKLKIKLNGNQLVSRFDDNSPNHSDSLSRTVESSSTPDTPLRANGSEAVCRDQDQPGAKKFKSLVADLPMPPSPPSSHY